MNELRRLLSGFIASLMVLSLILTPIPQVNVAWAEETEEVDCEEDAMSEDGTGKIYKPGCELDSSLTQAQLDNVYGNEGDKWKGHIEQAVMAMMSVVLIDNLAFKYMYAYDNMTYGNDCPQNVAAKITLRAALLGALSYIIGHVQANVKFQKAAEKAAEKNFSAKQKAYMMSDDSAEVKAAREAGEKDPRMKAFEDNNAQVAAYDALIQILYDQQDAVETKRTLEIIASAVFLGTAITEGVFIGKCKAKCGLDVGKAKAQMAEAQLWATTASGVYGSFITKMSSISSKHSLTCTPGVGGTAAAIAACAPTEGLIVATTAEIPAAEAAANAAGEADNAKKSLMDKIKNTKFFKALAKIPDAFKSSKVRGATNPEVEGLADPSQFSADVIQEEADAKTEAGVDFSAVQGEMTVDTTTLTSYTTQLAACKAGLSTWQGLAAGSTAACQPQAGVKEGCTCPAMAGEILELMQSPAIEGASTISYPGLKDAVDKMLAEKAKYEYTVTKCCGLKGISWADAQKYQAMFTALSNASSMFPKTKMAFEGINVDGTDMKLNMLMQQISAVYAAGQNVPANSPGGSFLHQGIITNSVHAKVKDIQPLSFKEILGIGGGGGGGSAGAYLKNRPKGGYDLEYVLPIVVENQLYQHSMKELVDWDSNDPKLIRKQIAQINKEIKRSSKEIKKAINEKLMPPGPVIASEESRMMEFRKALSTILSKFNPVQPAHAIGGGATGAIVGAGVGMLASQLGGPWGEVMNVASKYMMLKGILSMLGVGELFVKPRSRLLSWIAISVLNGAIIAFDSKVINDIGDKIEVMEKEKERFMNSSAARTGLQRGARGESKGGKLAKYDYNASRSSSKSIRGCAVPKGDSFAPAPCPARVPKQEFDLPELRNSLGGAVDPGLLNNMSLLTDGMYAAAAQGKGKDSLSAGQLDTVQNLNNALSKEVDKIVAKIDKEEAKSRIPASKRSEPLAKTLASFKRAFGISGGSGSSGGSLSSTGGSGGSSYFVEPDKEVINKGFTPTAVASAKPTTIPKPTKSKGFDLDFGDDETPAANTYGTTAGAGPKKQEKLEDFAIEHNDINKRKDVPIWKILSNRYILSYPKVLDEEDAKLEPDKVEKKKK